jgi:hypothetical protein
VSRPRNSPEPAPLAPESLLGEWVHRHEEDAGERMVFVRGGEPLPPSRGRRRLELRERGVLAASVPGRSDAPEPMRGHWSLDAGRLRLAYEAPERGEEEFRVEALEGDRLVLARLTT